MSEVSALTCPKCGGDMRSYERNSVVVDQCADCRGLFLDRGELERLIDAKARHYSDDRGDGGDRPQERKKSKKRSFLENLFEGE